MTVDAGLDRYRLLASALAGRSVQVAPVDPSGPAWTDGQTIYLDPTVAPDALLETVAVQASLVAAGSLELAIVDRLAKRRGLADRYLAIEGYRALACNEHLLPPAVRRVVDHDAVAGVDDAASSLAIALGRQALAAAPASFGAIRPRQVRALAERDGAGTMSQGEAGDQRAAAPARRLAELDEPDDHDDAGDVGQLLSSPVGGGGPVGRLLQRLLGSSRDRGGGGAPGADAPTHRGGPVAGRAGGFVVTSGARVGPDAADEHATGVGEWYPEWNVHKKRYRADWCNVIESDPSPEDVAPMAMPDALALRRSLGKLGMGLERCHRRPQGDDIDIDAAVEARVEALAGTAPDQACYVESVRRRRDLSVLVLLDVSGSAGEPGPAGKPVHEHQRLAAAALTTALADLGDRVRLDAFNSRGRTAVQITRVKRFDERLDGAVARRLGGLVPSAYTRLGAAIRHGAQVVATQGGTERRLLVVLSDGLAYDHGYEGAYGEADARRALLEARRRGVGCVCLSVGAGIEAAALRRVFGTAAHASVSTADELPRVIGPLFAAAIRTADAQRRVFQRTERTRERLELEREAS